MAPAVDLWVAVTWLCGDFLAPPVTSKPTDDFLAKSYGKGRVLKRTRFLEDLCHWWQEGGAPVGLSAVGTAVGGLILTLVSEYSY